MVTHALADVLDAAVALARVQDIRDRVGHEAEMLLTATRLRGQALVLLRGPLLLGDLLLDQSLPLPGLARKCLDALPGGTHLLPDEDDPKAQQEVKSQGKLVIRALDADVPRGRDEEVRGGQATQDHGQEPRPAAVAGGGEEHRNVEHAEGKPVAENIAEQPAGEPCQRDRDHGAAVAQEPAAMAHIHHSLVHEGACRIASV
jgi:hypothetical protein